MPQSLRPQPQSVRFELGFGRCRVREPLRRSGGHGDRRLDHLPLVGKRAGRDQADRGSCESQRHRADLRGAGHRRPDGANGRRRRCVARRHDRTGSAGRGDRGLAGADRRDPSPGRAGRLRPEPPADRRRSAVLRSRQPRRRGDGGVDRNAPAPGRGHRRSGRDRPPPGGRAARVRGDAVRVQGGAERVPGRVGRRRSGEDAGGCHRLQRGARRRGDAVLRSGDPDRGGGQGAADRSRLLDGARRGDPPGPRGGPRRGALPASSRRHPGAERRPGLGDRPGPRRHLLGRQFRRGGDSGLPERHRAGRPRPRPAGRGLLLWRGLERADVDPHRLGIRAGGAASPGHSSRRRRTAGRRGSAPASTTPDRVARVLLPPLLVFACRTRQRQLARTDTLR